MKTILSLLIVLTFNFAFAGPEDETCYYNHSNTSLKSIPMNICVGGGKVDTASNTIQIYSYFSDSNFYLKDSQLTQLKVDTQKNMIFESIKTITPTNSGNCEEAVQLQVKVQGTADRLGTIDAGSLSLTIIHSYWADSCHSKPVVNEVYFQ